MERGWGGRGGAQVENWIEGKSNLGREYSTNLFHLFPKRDFKINRFLRTGKAEPTWGGGKKLRS